MFRTVNKVKWFEWAEMLRASRRHHLCLWSTMHILALYLCWWSKFNVYSQKIVTKCDGIITICDSLVYYKMRWTVITNCDSFFITKCDTVYYKMRQVLQSAMIITNCDSTHDSWTSRPKPPWRIIVIHILIIFPF